MTTAVALLAIAAFVQDAPSRAGVDLHGKLYRAVFSSGTGMLTPGDLADVPPAERERLSRFLTRRAAFKSQYLHDANSFEQARVDAKKREVERAIVSLIDAPGIESRAVEFVKSARIAFEWEGNWQAPLEEADAAEEFLKRDPASPLAPYLYVFIAHRQRAAFEACARTQNVEGMKATSKKYRASLQRARSAADPIFALIADDLDRQAHVYVKTDQHPATFNPDA
jgi:hypothetical protein